MKKQNMLARVGIFALAATTLCTTALAAEVPKSEAPDKAPYLYYSDGVQVAKDVRCCFDSFGIYTEGVIG
ncbi:hypothetical protein [Flintibacter sp.]|uniref:hypothetical protein n=1 Tax=Flintibacter sp. TaxID=1918624 RepID=UPI003A395D56